MKFHEILKISSQAIVIHSIEAAPVGKLYSNLIKMYLCQDLREYEISYISSWDIVIAKIIQNAT